ncbi:MAG: hypothetical protein COA50_11620 [Flavobacteriaceae bacterium]|nr:MAG: hypothetical protein COA50_11620 [Flavobacteriaceae bacterium]
MSPEDKKKIAASNVSFNPSRVKGYPAYKEGGEKQQDRDCATCPSKIDFTQSQEDIWRNILEWAIYINGLPKDSDLRIQDIFEGPPEKSDAEKAAWFVGYEPVSTKKILTLEGYPDEYAVASVAGHFFTKNYRIVYASVNTINARMGIEFYTEPIQRSMASNVKEQKIAFSLDFKPTYNSKSYRFINNYIFNDRTRTYDKLPIQGLLEQSKIKD